MEAPWDDINKFEKMRKETHDAILRQKESFKQYYEKVRSIVPSVTTFEENLSEFDKMFLKGLKISL